MEPTPCRRSGKAILPNCWRSRDRKSEIKPKTEFHNTPAGIVRILKIAVGARRLAETGCVDAECSRNPVAGREQKKVRPVERVQCLHTEFDVCTLSNIRLLEKAEIPLLLPGPVQIDPLAELSRL